MIHDFIFYKLLQVICENKLAYKLLIFFLLNFIITNLLEIFLYPFIQFKNSFTYFNILTNNRCHIFFSYYELGILLFFIVLFNVKLFIWMNISTLFNFYLKYLISKQKVDKKNPNYKEKRLACLAKRVDLFFKNLSS